MINGGGPLQQPRPAASVGGTGSQPNDGGASGPQPIDGGGGGGGGGGSPSNMGGVGLSPDRRPGNRLGALIGGGPASQRGGGPMLVIGNDNDEAF